MLYFLLLVCDVNPPPRAFCCSHATSLVTCREEHAARLLLQHPEHGGAKRHGLPLPPPWSPAWWPAAPQSLPVHVPAWQRQGKQLPEHSLAADRRQKRHAKNLSILPFQCGDYTCNVTNIVVEPPSPESSPDSDGCTPVSKHTSSSILTVNILLIFHIKGFLWAPK